MKTYEKNENQYWTWTDSNILANNGKCIIDCLYEQNTQLSDELLQKDEFIEEQFKHLEHYVKSNQRLKQKLQKYFLRYLFFKYMSHSEKDYKKFMNNIKHYLTYNNSLICLECYGNVDSLI
jgi:hypothetical protein